MTTTSNSVAAAAWLGRLRLDPPQVVGGCQIHPICLEPAGPAPHLLLTHQAIATRALEVLEQGEGVVQELLAWNRGVDPVVILEGDTLVGCKQNRVVARSTILGGGVKTPIPVGCMERGRWHRRSSEFSTGDLRVPPTLRRQTSAEIRTAKKTGARRVALDQSRLWDTVELSLCGAGVSSPSSDYHTLIQEKGREARERLRSLEARPGQVGVLVMANGAFLGLEIAGHPSLWAELAERTLPSYLIDPEWAKDEVGRAGARAEAPAWLDRLRQARLDVSPGLGLGTEVDVEDETLAGSGLWLGSGFVHLAVFPRA
jgi:hypothetical protein